MRSGVLRATYAVAILTASLLVAAGPAQGSSKTVKDCDAAKRDLTDLYPLKNTPSVSRVDHVNEHATPADLKSTHAATDEIDVRAPILYLTPRVSDLLEDVFLGSVEEDDELDSPPSSPVADSTDDVDAGLHDVENEASVVEEILPAFQQEMFRKDI